LYVTHDVSAPPHGESIFGDPQIELDRPSTADGALVPNLPVLGAPLVVGRFQPAIAKRRSATVVRLDAAAKRGFDTAMALASLLILLPVFLALATLVKLDSRGPVFFRCRRRGLGGCDIHVLKFRKMHHGSRGGALTLQEDSRLTRVGRILAATRLDELPQLWNVLRGDMSLVGPRPEDPRFVDLRGADFEHVLSVRPGITGLSQLAYAKEREILGDDDPTRHYVDRVLPQKIALDTLYASTRTLAMDLAILLWTVVPIVLRRDVAVERDTGRLGLRRRPAR
jgi:lipopolysaccharide/colanic/teichoic acid biosynthesis glycosyltransferase